MIKSLMTAAALATMILSPALAQEPPVVRKLLEKMEFPPEQYATILGSAVLQPGAKLDRHTHPGIEMGMAMEGETILLIEG
jgi:quercetin dioxygenase-like cupin family protein